ncbi:hypothetical protein B0T26DRAFT_599476, partial [Lasiosphaeria miniovina]
CGLSPAEARELGCVFDAVLMAWVPWRCHDAKLNSEFLARKDWQFYGDPDWNSTSRALPLSYVLAGEWDKIYITIDFNLFHCTYTWRKAWQAAMKGDVLDGYIGDSHHTNHCEMLLMSDPLKERSVYMKYADCPRVRYDNGRFGWYRVINRRKIHR